MPNPGASSKIPSGYRRLPGSERSAAPDAELIGPASDSDRVHVTVVLRRRPDGPPVPDPSYYLNTPPSQRRRLSQGEFAERAAAARADLANQLSDLVDARAKELQGRQAKDLKETEARLTQGLEARLRELQEKLSQRTQLDKGEGQAALNARILESDGRIAEKVESIRSELQEAQVRSMADLQVRLQAYTDQKLREDLEKERQKYVELMARLKGEVDAIVARVPESAKFDQAVRDRVQRGLEAQRPELQRIVDARATTTEDAVRVDLAEVTERLQRAEADVGSRREEFQKLEETVRSELDDLDRRAQILADRLVPVVRKTWLRISELEKMRPEETSGPALDAVRRDLQREVRRLEVVMDERVQEIRGRMETAISNQGRVWLTLVRQLSQLTEDRRVIEESRAMLRQRRPGDRSDEPTNLEALPGLLQPSSRDDLDDEEDEDASRSDRTRRRRRPYARG